MKHRISALCLLSSVLGGLAGCNLPQPQADAVRNFTLGSPVTVAPVTGAVQVRPVVVAGHLRGRPMAVRVSEHEVVYLEDVRWAEPLDEAITRMLRARLASVGGGATVTVTVSRCELVRAADNTVQLAASYAIARAGGDPAAVERGVFTAPPRTWDGQDYGGVVVLLHDAVAELGDALATAVEKK
jgi:ABC-type transport auxiliary lipoprotein component